jgi:hypothetical protein
LKIETRPFSGIFLHLKGNMTLILQGKSMIWLGTLKVKD